MSVPLDLFDRLLGFKAPSAITSLMLLPYPDPRGGWLDYVRVKCFPPIEDETGTTKYLGPRGVPPRLYVPIPTIPKLDASESLWLCEGEKKALAAAQLGLAAVGFGGIEAWHARGSTALIEDFARIVLKGRLVELVPDGDVATNTAVARGITKLADALQARGARVRVRLLPVALPEAI
jgi:hypothetical protein